MAHDSLLIPLPYTRIPWILLHLRGQVVTSNAPHSAIPASTPHRELPVVAFLDVPRLCRSADLVLASGRGGEVSHTGLTDGVEGVDGVVDGQTEPAGN